MGEYAIRGGVDGKRRLDLLAQVMAPATQALLAGVAAGMQCFDLGCGGGHVSRWLAQRVGDGGRVVGIDIDPVKVAAAREECARAQLHNVEFRCQRAADWHEQERYDLVYARFVLSHLAERQAVLARMIDALRPGGMVVLEDVDFSGAFTHPPNRAYARYCDWYRAVVARRGGNADLGPELYGLCTDAGLVDIEVGVVQPLHAGCEPGKTLQEATLVNIRDAVVAEGLATAEEVETTLADLRRHGADPRSIVALPRIFQIRARRRAA